MQSLSHRVHVLMMRFWETTAPLACCSHFLGLEGQTLCQCPQLSIAGAQPSIPAQHAAALPGRARSSVCTG